LQIGTQAHPDHTIHPDHSVHPDHTIHPDHTVHPDRVAHPDHGSHPDRFTEKAQQEMVEMVRRVTPILQKYSH
jgi:hypothetical protein